MTSTLLKNFKNKKPYRYCYPCQYCVALYQLKTAVQKQCKCSVIKMYILHKILYFQRRIQYLIIDHLHCFCRDLFNYVSMKITNRSCDPNSLNSSTSVEMNPRIVKLSILVKRLQLIMFDTDKIASYLKLNVFFFKSFGKCIGWQELAIQHISYANPNKKFGF
jgi:hypothetical protein